MKITPQQRQQNEDRIRAAMDRILHGDYAEGGKCDVKTLARESGVSRAAIYSTYAHLKEEFEQRRERLLSIGSQPDPRVAQIDSLKSSIARLKLRVAKQNAELKELRTLRDHALSQLIAQHDEILRLRTAASDHHLHVLDRPPPH